MNGLLFAEMGHSLNSHRQQNDSATQRKRKRIKKRKRTVIPNRKRKNIRKAPSIRTSPKPNPCK